MDHWMEDREKWRDLLDEHCIWWECFTRI